MRYAPLVLAAICALVLFTGLDSVGLLDFREARDAQVAREVVGAREPLTPLLGHDPLFEKPILGYGPEVALRLLSSAPERRSRTLRACIGVLLVVVVASIAAEHFGLRAAAFTALVLVTSLVLPYTTRADGTQLYATLFGWLGCAGFADALFGRRGGRDLRLVVSYGALGAALVCAGPLPALWPLAGLALYVALAHAPDGWRRIRPLAGLGLMLGLALPWYGAMLERHGGVFLAHLPFFPYAAESRGAWTTGLVLTINLLVVGLFPWTALLPAALLHAGTWWRRPRAALPPGAAADPARPRPAGDPDGPRADPISREEREERSAHFFVACLIAALIPVLFYPLAPLSAALPALPAAALLCGRFLDHLFEAPERVARPFGRATLMLALLGTAGGAMLALLARYVPEAARELRLIGTTVFVTSWTPFLAGFMGRRRLAGALIALPVAIATPLVTVRLLPAMESYLSTRAVAEAMEVAAPPLATLVLTDPAPPSLRFYVGRNLAVAPALAPALEEHRAADGLAYVAFRPRREPEVARAAPGPLEILIRTPSLVLARVHRG